MRNNKAILDEAARSVRRTFIGSIAGTVTMLAVVGAAGAYGMPERLTAQALAAAMARFDIKFARERSAQPLDRPVVVAQNMMARAPMPASPVADVAPEEPVVKPLPQVAAPAAPVAAPVTPVTAPATPAIAPMPMSPVADVAPPQPVVKSLPQVEAPVAPAIAPVAEAAPVAPEPAPQMTASLTPLDPPEPADAPSVISAPMVFEAPKPADAQMLTELPKTELVPEAAAAQARAVADPDPAEFPKSVMIHMPLPKPPLTPAQRLDLQGKDYDKAEKCLAQAVYFEARAEPVRGQMAVAQVVLNRVFSPYYPKDICSVVYQNASHFLSCQFTFTCDGKPETINERGPWARANRIAKEALAAKIWLPEVAKATHYHASYVRPNWIRDMKVMARFGIHTFYRPRNWGDGSNEPAWGAGAVKKAAKS